jgi:hypothetical protein
VIALFRSDGAPGFMGQSTLLLMYRRYAAKRIGQFCSSNILSKLQRNETSVERNKQKRNRASEKRNRRCAILLDLKNK